MRGEVDRMRTGKILVFQAIELPKTPKVRNDSLSRNDVDRFVLAKAHDLKPSEEASKADFIRRATFDLLGLPTPRKLKLLQDDPEDAHETGG